MALSARENITLADLARSRALVRHLGALRCGARRGRSPTGSASAARAGRRPPATSRAATSRSCCSRAGRTAPPRVLLADEPTRGIDVGAKAEILGRCARLAAQGLAVRVRLLRARGGRGHQRPRRRPLAGPHRRRSSTGERRVTASGILTPRSKTVEDAMSEAEPTPVRAARAALADARAAARPRVARCCCASRCCGSCSRSSIAAQLVYPGSSRRATSRTCSRRTRRSGSSPGDDVRA